MKTRGNIGQLLVTVVSGNVGPSSSAQAVAHQTDEMCEDLEGD